MRTEAASNPTCDHFGFSCRQRILPDLSNSDCLPGRAGGTPVGLAALCARERGSPRLPHVPSPSGIILSQSLAIRNDEASLPCSSVRSFGEAKGLARRGPIVASGAVVITRHRPRVVTSPLPAHAGAGEGRVGVASTPRRTAMLA